MQIPNGYHAIAPDPFATPQVKWPIPHMPPINLYNMPKQEGLKYDTKKNKLELVDPLAIEGLGRVLTFGANKYEANNWRNGIEFTRLIGALKRHLSEIEKGVDIDPESGEQHIDHLGCCWMFLSNFMKTRPDLDDRWYARNGPVEKDI